MSHSVHSRSCTHQIMANLLVPYRRMLLFWLVTCGSYMQLEAVLGFNGGAALEWRPDLGLLAYGVTNAVVLEQHSATRQRFSLSSPSLTRATVRPDESSLHAINPCCVSPS